MNITQVNRAALLSYASINDPWLDGLIEREAPKVASENYYRFLYHLMRLHKPEVAIELGVEFGIGSAHMAKAAAEYGGLVIGVDHHKHEIPHSIIPARFPGCYHFIIARTLDAIDEELWAEICGRVGLVFQDTAHHYQESKEEWEFYSLLLAPGAIWVCDDVSDAFYDPLIDPPGKGMVQYFDDLPGEKIKFYDRLHNIGVALL